MTLTATIATLMAVFILTTSQSASTSPYTTNLIQNGDFSSVSLSGSQQTFSAGGISQWISTSNLTISASNFYNQKWNPQRNVAVLSPSTSSGTFGLFQVVTTPQAHTYILTFTWAPVTGYAGSGAVNGRLYWNNQPARDLTASDDSIHSEVVVVTTNAGGNLLKFEGVASTTASAIAVGEIRLLQNTNEEFIFSSL